MVNNKARQLDYNRNELSHSMSRNSLKTASSISDRDNLQNYLLQNAVNATINNLSEDDKDKKIISEFAYLLDKSKQLFNGLRDLPQYGHNSNQWQAYFGRTFDVYTKLWKFQQQYRTILEQRFSLKRWQIGEIASKIGQLYYHYYLRTSESNYLYESYSFYQAILTRNYYSKANKEEKPDLMVKKLRFYARFIVVCLLLKKAKQIRDLTKDLSRHIDDYVKIYDPEDQLEWQLVKNEINDFIQGDNLVNVDASVSLKMVISNRLDVSQVPQFGLNDSKSNFNLNLQEILIIGNCQNQIKFSELSLDMFRMLQAVERQPTSDVPDLDNNDSKKMTASLNIHEKGKLSEFANTHTIIQRNNPHKYLLYKPSFSQFLTYISAAFKDLPPHGVMLVYMSADGYEMNSRGYGGENNSYETGGVKTNSRREMVTSTSSLNLSANHNTNSMNRSSNFKSDSHNKLSGYKEVHCIYPGDLCAFLRKPLFLIVDSTNSIAFQNIPNMFGQPFIGLFSPVTLPSVFNDKQNQNGSIFTLFLTNPLFGFCAICDVDDLTAEVYYKAQQLIRVIFNDLAKMFYRSKNVDHVFLQISHDDFCRVFLLRFVFCYYSFRLHKGFKGSDYYPTSKPMISIDIIENAQIQHSFIELAKCLNANQLFLDPYEP